VIKKHIKRRILFILIVIAALSTTLIYIFLYSNLLVVKSIEVRGNKLISSEQIMETSQISLNSPLIKLPISDITQRILEISQIGSVEVRQGWPSNVVIQINERIPLATTNTSEGEFLVDVTGKPYLYKSPEDSYPFITGPDDQSRAFAIAVWQTFPDWLKAEVTSTNADNTSSIWLMLNNGRKVLWGSINQANDKAAVLKVLRRMAGSAYDVSIPETPVVRP